MEDKDGLWARGGSTSRSQPPSDLPWQAEEALVELFRLSADGETMVEQRRSALLQMRGFGLTEVFTALAAATGTLWDRVPLAGLHQWLHAGCAAAPSRVEPSAHELARVLLRLKVLPPPPQDGQLYLNFADFLRLVLPRDPEHRAIRLGAQSAEPCDEEDPSTGAAVSRKEKVIVGGGNSLETGMMDSSVSLALRRLIEEEVELFRRGRQFRCELAEYMAPTEVFAMFCGSVAFQKRVTDPVVADLVTDRLGALSFLQAAALFRRLDASGQGEVSEEDVQVLVGPLHGNDVTCDGLPLD